MSFTFFKVKVKVVKVSMKNGIKNEIFKAISNVLDQSMN